MSPVIRGMRGRSNGRRRRRRRPITSRSRRWSMTTMRGGDMKQHGYKRPLTRVQADPHAEQYGGRRCSRSTRHGDGLWPDLVHLVARSGVFHCDAGHRDYSYVQLSSRLRHSPVRSRADGRSAHPRAGGSLVVSIAVAPSDSATPVFHLEHEHEHPEGSSTHAGLLDLSDERLSHLFRSCSRRLAFLAAIMQPVRRQRICLN